MSTVTPLTSADFDAFHAVYTAAYSRDFDCPWLAVEKRVNLTADAYDDTVALAIHDDAGIVGGATAILPLHDNRDFAFLDVFVHPDRRRAGHGSALLEALLGCVRAVGRTIAFAQPYWAVDEDTSPARNFAEARGFELQTWRGPCPDDLLDEYAELRRILTSEAPNGDAGLENEHWDAARVRKDEDDLVLIERQMQVTVARAPEGGLAGHTQLAIPGSGLDVYQWDTLVRRQHRGHGLGLALKIRTMHAAADLLEGRRRIITENAASNSHMIAVNDALGFRQVAWVGEYVRTL